MRIMVWLRNDLRLDDHPALWHACERGPITPFVLVPRTEDTAFSGWRQAHIMALNDALNGRLNVYTGMPREVIPTLMASHPIAEFHWNSLTHRPSASDEALMAYLHKHHIQAHAHPAPRLWAPDTIMKHTGQPYQIFTPFYRACLNTPPSSPIDPPLNLACDPLLDPEVTAERALPAFKSWQRRLLASWPVGTARAAQRWADFSEGSLALYERNRDLFEASATSRLSPYWAVGSYSERRLYAQAQAHDPNISAPFIRQVCWRAFAHTLALHHPTLAHEPMRPIFGHMAWRNHPEHIRAWKEGKTGIPIIDASMRELWRTGYMPNRLRMVVASFFTKHLNCDWRLGADWFMETLLDADEAVNAMNWQWVAGTGVDSAPYYRIFNPITQSKRYDPDGMYLRAQLPELARLPDPWVHTPWLLPQERKASLGFSLGRDYPHPIIDLDTARRDALKRYEALKSAMTPLDSH